MNARITTLKMQLSSVDTRCALLCIRQKGAGHKCFFWGGQMWTANQALDTWEDWLLKMECGTFGVIRFYGGPPEGGKWYDGTVLSMLCDLILFNENTEHSSPVERSAASIDFST